MGWGGGTGIADEVITGLRVKQLDDKTRQQVYEVLIPSLQGEDWDNLYECFDQDEAFDRAAREVCPEYFDDEDG